MQQKLSMTLKGEKDFPNFFNCEIMIGIVFTESSHITLQAQLTPLHKEMLSYICTAGNTG